MSDAKSNGSQLAVPHGLLLIMLASVYPASGIKQKLYGGQTIYLIIYLFIVCLVSFSSCCFLFFFRFSHISGSL